MSTSTLDYYAREADRIARGPQLYGGNADIVKLRCFKYYHPDVGSWMTAPDGKQRWFGPKTSRIYATLHRDAGKHTTMKDVAREAQCAPSTVSRAITRLQAWGFMAVDVKRGRGGGIVATLARIKGQFRAHVDAAWRRIHSWIKVASRSALTGTRHDKYQNYKDATFSCGLLDCEGFDHAPLPSTATSRAADQERARAEEFARQVVDEIRRLDAGEPDWDLWYEKVRASHGIDPIQ